MISDEIQNCSTLGRGDDVACMILMHVNVALELMVFPNRPTVCPSGFGTQLTVLFYHSKK